ncbi:MAG: hypothetical protein Q4B32_06990 [Clostridia bacterium]|nr:hypothetical protein [Clostridia bacterium]
MDKAVRHPFGYGLSCTTFAYSDIHADSKSVTFSLTNTGDMDGAVFARQAIDAGKSVRVIGTGDHIPAHVFASILQEK